MNFRLAVLIFQSAFTAAHINDGCYIEDETAYTGQHFMHFYTNVASVFACASYCRAYDNCSFCTLFKDGDQGIGGYGDLWQKKGIGRADTLAISGSAACRELN